MQDRAKLIVIGMLIISLVVLMAAYFLLARGNAELTGGFLVLSTYLIKKIADEAEEIIDRYFDIKPTQPTQTTEVQK
jgi:hypothetical protein